MFIFQKPTRGFLGSFYFFSGPYFFYFHCVFFFLISMYLLTFALVLGGWFGYVWFGVFFGILCDFLFLLSVLCGIKLCWLLESFFLNLTCCWTISLRAKPVVTPVTFGLLCFHSRLHLKVFYFHLDFFFDHSLFWSGCSSPRIWEFSIFHAVIGILFHIITVGK